MFRLSQHFRDIPFTPVFIALVLAVGVFLCYSDANRELASGEIVLPLDDTYIHFQYARQLALGQPYVYNPGDPPTSGATSFLYPYLLAAGYHMGFQGLNLGLWALLIGTAALWVSSCMIYLLGVVMALPRWTALLGMIAFAANGAFHWHFMSGMETGLMIALTLATLYGVVTARLGWFVFSATLLALTRPEGGIFSVLAAAAVWLSQSGSGKLIRTRPSGWLLLPVLAVGVQPLVNFAITGSLSASGSQAKSILGMIPLYWDVIFERILANGLRVWSELFTRTNGRYMPGIIPLLAVFGWCVLLNKRSYRPVALMTAAWFVCVGGAISTLDTAFWHFKRYQMPLLALIYPLALWGLGGLWRINVHVVMRHIIRGTIHQRWITNTVRARLRFVLPLFYRGLRAALFTVVALILVGQGAVIITEFHRLYRVNVNNVVTQPLAMARWLAQNTAADAVVAVHDVGMMRYMGERYTIDMVGLTTPGAADAWRNGPGAVAEFLMSHVPAPDYIAAYTTARGLNYLVESGLYSETLAAFPAVFDPADNVALAADYQGIFRFCCAQAEPRAVGQEDRLFYARLGMQAVVDTVDVAHLESETAHDYAWTDQERQPGFATEVYRFSTTGCSAVTEAGCTSVDGGRRLNGTEAFTLAARPYEDGLLVTRVHAADAGRYQVYVNERWLDTQWLPQVPGHWLDIMTLIPAEVITEDQVHVRIEAEIPGGHYRPYQHVFWQGRFMPLAGGNAAIPSAMLEGVPVASYQEGAFTLRAQVLPDLRIALLYQSDGRAYGDYKVFVHVYSDPDQPPIAQLDFYPGTSLLDDGETRVGLYPPGNWLPGVILDTIRVDLSQIPPGQYRAAVGFYEAASLERLVPTLLTAHPHFQVDNGGRLFIGEITIPSE